MVDVGAVGSPTDVATFFAVLYLYRGVIRDQIEVTAAGVVALAEGDADVDEDRLRADLPVDDDRVASIRQAVRDRGDRDGR